MENTTLNLTMRPRSFSEVLGMESAVESIRTKLESGCPRAFLFVGPYGTGKTTLAKIVARVVQGPFFPEDMEPQVREINAANFTGVDDMRALVEKARSFPMPPSTHGVIILDEAHMLTKQAQNLLLKEFETEKSPTVWMICTTDENKLLEGLRSGRTFKIQTRGMDDTARRALVTRAAKETGHDGNLEEFCQALRANNIVSPRAILMAFELFHCGQSINEAIGSQSFEGLPDYFDIAWATVYGKWDAPVSDFRKPGTQLKAVRDLLKDLDTKLKNKPKAEDTDDESVEPDDLDSKPQVAKTLRIITAAILKGQIIGKNAAKADRAADALDILSRSVCPDPALEYTTAIGALYRVNRWLNKPAGAR